jgi:hypothetical protein
LEISFREMLLFSGIELLDPSTISFSYMDMLYRARVNVILIRKDSTRSRRSIKYVLEYSTEYWSTIVLVLRIKHMKNRPHPLPAVGSWSLNCIIYITFVVVHVLARTKTASGVRSYHKLQVIPL